MINIIDILIIGDNIKNKKKNKILLLIILVVGITIGFAALSTTLKINGTAGIAKNTWNIYWDNIDNISGVESSTPVISEDEDHKPNTLVTWTVTLNEPGDYYEFTVDAVNAGTVDAMITNITHKLNGEEMSDVNKLPDYINYSVKYADGTDISLNDLLEKRVDATHFTTKTYKVRIEYDKDAVSISDVNDMDDEGVTYDLSFEVKYGQYAESTVPSPVAFSTDSWDTIASVGRLSDPTTGPYQVGDIKEIEMDLDNNGINETYRLRISNTKNASTASECGGNNFSQTACGLVIEFEDIMFLHRINPYTDGSTNGNGTTGGWEYSEIRSYLNNDIYNKLPKELRNVIIPTRVVSGYGSNDTVNFTTTDKLYLLSTHEIWVDVDGSPDYGIDKNDTAYSYTRQLDYYSSFNTTTDSYSSAIKKYNNRNYSWSLRSAARLSNESFFNVSSAGRWIVGDVASVTTFGISPTFRIG